MACGTVDSLVDLGPYPSDALDRVSIRTVRSRPFLRLSQPKRTGPPCLSLGGPSAASHALLKRLWPQILAVEPQEVEGEQARRRPALIRPEPLRGNANLLKNQEKSVLGELRRQSIA
jgi:hypothetical protein